MFKPTENATMEVQGFDLKVIEACFQYSSKHKIQRLILDYDGSIMQWHTYKNLAMCHNNIGVFLKCSYDNFKKAKSSSDLSLIYIVTTSQSKGIEDTDIPNLYWEIIVGKDEEIETKYLNIDRILWNIEFERETWDNFNRKVERLIDGYTTSELMFSNILLHKVLVKEHPCNVYLCAGEHCHSRHGNIPRYISVKSNGSMYPYNLITDEYAIGNICGFSDNAFRNYQSSKQKLNFIEANRKLYICLLDKCNYEFIPWFELLNGDIYDR